MTNHKEKCMPKRIILVRHGESQGNLDGTAYSITPDNKIPLTQLGIQQSKIAGQKIRRVISDDDTCFNWKVYFYVSPYERTRATLREIGRSFCRESVIGAREEVRVREQDFGNFQESERMKTIKETRERYGRFFYRFPEGESAADVFDRVSSFLESLWRDIDMNRLHHKPSDDLNLVIVSHGLASRVFLMKWFKWTVEQFEDLNNLENAEFRVMQLGHGGDYSLAIHHSAEQMLQWGLSSDMIADQQFRSQACRGCWNEKCSWYFDSFFDKLVEATARDLSDRKNEEERLVEMLEFSPEEEDHENREDEEHLENKPDEAIPQTPNEDSVQNNIWNRFKLRLSASFTKKETS
ncbi:phosphoglycerate mutase-like protein AT74H [Apium graveolens]|uniref:phosphoglycerate mutase-like protein AT74H n=1 Tax=Apium graveolens TaxID=4045 RepID=UPI003D7C0ADB